MFLNSPLATSPIPVPKQYYQTSQDKKPEEWNQSSRAQARVCLDQSHCFRVFFRVNRPDLGRKCPQDQPAQTTSLLLPSPINTLNLSLGKQLYKNETVLCFGNDCFDSTNTGFD